MKLQKTHKKNNIYNIVIYVIYVNFFKGYISYLPTIPIYPNNNKDLEKMKSIMKTRTQEDVDYFLKLTIVLFQHFYHMLTRTKIN